MKRWDLLTPTQKRHRVFKVLVVRKICFWKVCGKDRQAYYKEASFDEANIDSLREELYAEYLGKVNDGRRFYEIDEKIDEINKLLRKGDYE